MVTKVTNSCIKCSAIMSCNWASEAEGGDSEFTAGPEGLGLYCLSHITLMKTDSVVDIRYRDNTLLYSH